MKNSEKIVLGMLSAAALGIILYLTKKRKTFNRLTQIADEGYETAGDILFPMKRKKNCRTRYTLNRWENGLFY